jgi:hypothetical protein
MILIESIEPDCDNISRFAAKGDSGAALINAQNQLIGLIMFTLRSDPTKAIACHIHPVLDRLGVTPITTANPHPAASKLSNLPGVIVDGEFNHTPQLQEKFLSTAKGSEIFALVQAHRLEVVDLVNHRRPVTVAWHRSQGPLFLSHILNNARDPAHIVPREVNGVHRATLIRNMAEVLSAHGSAELKATVERYLDEVLSHVDQFDNLHEWVEELSSVSKHE